MIASWTRIEKYEGSMGKKQVAQCSLTPKQQETLDHIIGFQRKYGRTPTIRELCRLMNIKSTNGIVDRLNRLEAKGKIRRNKDPYRNIEIVGCPSIAARHRALLEGLRQELTRLRRLPPEVLKGMAAQEKRYPITTTTSLTRIKRLLRGGLL